MNTNSLKPCKSYSGHIWFFFLGTMIFSTVNTSSFCQALEIEGNSRVIGRVDLRSIADSTSVSIGRNAAAGSEILPIAFNTYAGWNSGAMNVSGKYNTVFGSEALNQNTRGDNNTSLGSTTLFGNDSSMNTAAGYFALGNDLGTENTAFGYSSAIYNFSGNRNVFLGSMTSQGNQNEESVSIGYANSLYGSIIETVTIGDSAGYAHDNTQSVIIGNQAASHLEGSHNIILGNQAARDQLSGDDMLWIENTSASVPLIYGDFSSGKVGINCISPQAALSVIGNIQATGTITASAMACSSDRRFKRNISNLENSLPQVLELRPVRYHWRQKEFPEKKFNARAQVGFVAQEVEQLYPEIIKTGSDGFKSMDYGRLTVVLTKALQELMEKNSSLADACDQLERRIEKLEKKSHKAAFDRDPENIIKKL